MKTKKHRLAALCLGISISLLLGACSLQKEGTSTVNPGQVQEISVALLEPSSQEPTSWEKIPERFPVQNKDDWVYSVLSNEVLEGTENVDSLSLNFTFKYPDTGVAIYEILDENGNSYTDFSLKAPLERTMIYKTIVRGDQTQFTLDGFTKSNGTEILPYEIEITYKDQKIQYYPTFYPREEIPIPNGLSEYFQLKKITKIQSITKEQRMSSYGLLSQKKISFVASAVRNWEEEKEKKKLEYIEQIKQENQIEGDTYIRIAFDDGKGTIYYKVALKNFEKEDLYSYDFLQTPNENGNNSMKLPTGDGYISVYHEKDVSIEKEKYFLEEYAGEALGESNNSIKIDFPMDPIVNPENIEEELWFGRLLKNGTAYMITRAMIRILLFYVLEMKL